MYVLGTQKGYNVDEMDIGFLQDCLITESNNIYKAQKRMENNNKPKTRKATQADFDLL